MTRTDAIAQITCNLASLGDEGLESVAAHVEDLVGARNVRPLTDLELGLIEQSKADFAAGRTVSMQEARVLSDDLIRRWRGKSSSNP